MGMPVPAEWSTGRRQNVFRIAARTPWELRISRRSAGLGTGERPWGADPKRHGSPRLLRVRAREGTSGCESSRDGPWMMCFEGGSVTLGPRPWNQGGRAQVPSSRRSFRPRIPQSSRLWSTADEGAQGCGNASRPSHSKESHESEPQERQRTQRVLEAGGRRTRRGGEKPRGRNVPGVANPGHADPSADVAEGARNPRRGGPVQRGTGEGTLARTLRGRQSLWKRPRSLRTPWTAERRNTSRS